MCDLGIKQLLQELRLSDVNGWEPIHDGFGTRPSGARDAPRRAGDLPCPVCGCLIILVRRELVTEAYNLSDVAIYQALEHNSLCIALGEVSSRTTGTAGTPEDLRRWQGLLWHVYGVAFAVVTDGAIGEWCPAEFPEPAPESLRSELSCIADKAAEALRRARREGTIPVGCSSRDTEPEVLRVLEPVFKPFGYLPSRRLPAKAPYHGVRGQLPDGAFMKRRDGTKFAIEVKVDEDWDHPLVSSLIDLLGYDAVLLVRVPPSALDRAADVRDLIAVAERKLEETGRARFIYVWPGR